MDNSRKRLKDELDDVQNSSLLRTPSKKIQKVIVIENHLADLLKKPSTLLSPDTQEYIKFQKQRLRSTSSTTASLVDRGTQVVSLAEHSYLKKPFAKQPLSNQPSSVTETDSYLKQPSSMTTPNSSKLQFSGKIPSNSNGERKRKNAYSDIAITHFSSMALAKSSIGATLTIVKTTHWTNGVTTEEIKCSTSECSFKARISFDSPAGEKKCTPKEFSGPVGLQVAKPHCCKTDDRKWSSRLQMEDRRGMNPVLNAELKQVMADISSTTVKNPKPAHVYQLIQDRVSHYHEIMPTGCSGVLQSQIMNKVRRENIKKNREQQKNELPFRYLEEVKIFRKEHELQLPPDYRAEDWFSLQEGRCVNTKELASALAEAALKKTRALSYHKVFSRPIHNAAVVDDDVDRGKEHDFFVLPLPDLDDEKFGYLRATAIIKEYVKDGDKNEKKIAENNIVCFSTINLLRQVTISQLQYSGKMLFKVSDKKKCVFLILL